MTSLKFSYSFKLFKESLKQNRNIIIMHTILLLLATILPAQLAIADLAERVREFAPSIINYRAEYTYYISGFSIFTMLVMCLSAFATMSFSYLYNSRSAIFYGALPYKKGTMFAARYLSGITSLFVPVLICYIINGIIFLNHSEVLGGVDFWWYTKNWLFVALNYLLIYSLCTFAASLSCNIFAQLIIMGALILVYPSVVFILSETVNVMFKTYMIDYKLNAFYLWPPFATVFYSSGINYLITALIAISESIVLSVLAYFAYIKRKAEKCNNFYAYSWITGILKYFITFLCSAGFGLLLVAINRGNNAIAYIGYIIFGFVGYAIIQMIFEKSPKAMFKNMKGFVIFIVIVSLLASIPVFDVLNLDEKAPNAEKLQKVTITKVDAATSYWHGGSKIELTEPESIKAACDLFASGSFAKNMYARQFTLKENNSIFTRRINNLPKEKIVEFLKTVYDNKDYKDALKIDETLFDQFDDDWRFRINVNKNAFYKSRVIDGKEMVYKFVEVYNNDVTNTKAEDIDFTEVYAYVGIPSGEVVILKEYKNTIKLLEEEFLIKPDYDKFKVIELKNTYNDTTEHVITDPEKIKFIIDNISDYNYNDGNEKGYHICYESTSGEMVNHFAWVTESYLKKHNIL